MLKTKPVPLVLEELIYAFQKIKIAKTPNGKGAQWRTKLPISD